MLLRGIFPKLYRRRVNLDRHIESAVAATSHVITLVETLQINRLSAFWWSCESTYQHLTKQETNRHNK